MRLQPLAARAGLRPRAWRRCGPGIVRWALILAVGAAAAACGGQDAGSSQNAPAAPPASAAPTPTAAAPANSLCHAPAAGSAGTQKWGAEPPMTLVPTATYTAVLGLNCGNVTLALDAARAPHTVNSFVFLAGQHFFDHSPCHRLTTQGIFVLQCGDPTGTGTGGPGYTIPDENLSGATYPAGTVAMANTGQPHSGGSQFFLVYKDTQLPPSYTPFAHISGGLDVLQQIAAMGTTDGGPDGAPKAHVVIDAVTVTHS